jgi:uncharacterized membrane protein
MKNLKNKKFLKFHFLILFLICSSTLNLELNRIKLNKKLVDEKFVKIFEKLKDKLIKEGSNIKKLSIKFISKNNRFIVADEDIKVINFKKIFLIFILIIKHLYKSSDNLLFYSIKLFKLFVQNK